MLNTQPLLASNTSSFDRETYAEKLRRFNASKNYRIDLDHLLPILDRIPFTSLLDVGCGTGYFVDVVRRRYDTPRVDGLDRFDYGAVGCAIADICAAKFSWERCYDVVTIIHAVNHFVELDIAVSRIATLIKPGGYLLMLTPNPAFVRIVRLLNEYAYLSTQGGDSTVISYLGIPELEPRMATRQLSLIETSAFGSALDCMLNETKIEVAERLLLVFRKADT